MQGAIVKVTGLEDVAEAFRTVTLQVPGVSRPSRLELICVPGAPFEIAPAAMGGRI